MSDHNKHNDQHKLCQSRTPQRVLRASIRREIGEFDDRFLIRPEIEDDMKISIQIYFRSPNLFSLALATKTVATWNTVYVCEYT